MSWNSTKRWILRYSERPHITAVAIEANESSSSVMSLASLATDVPYITFLNARETNDVWYTAVLPVTKRESVLGKDVYKRQARDKDK